MGFKLIHVSYIVDPDVYIGERGWCFLGSAGNSKEDLKQIHVCIGETLSVHNLI